jgi:hypothetical protein
MLVFKELIYNGVTQGNIPARTRLARDWYRDAASQVLDGRRDLKPRTIERHFEEKRKVGRVEPGTMYMFRYDPKHKKTLPYYDVFPVVFPIKMEQDGFVGINFHYLPPTFRANLMDALYSITTDKRYDENTKVLATYNILQKASKFRYFKPTVKRYLSKFVRSPFMQITAAEWDIAIFLPVENFKKASKEDVWAESRKMVK